MSGAKETPRQKMIGMMYLVYTALLAMNVSADILDAFALVSEGQQKTNASIEVKIDGQYKAFEDLYQKETSKTQIYWDKANEIRNKTDEIINYIERDVKFGLLAYAEKKTEAEILNPNSSDKPLVKNIEKTNPNNRRVFYDVNMENCTAKDNYDAPIFLMINQGKATELKNKIQEYRQFVVSTMESAGLQNYNRYVGLLTDVDVDGNPIVYTNANKEEIDWEHKNFDHVVCAAEYAILNKLVGEIQTTEFDAISSLMNRIGASDYKINRLQARIVPKSDYITQGQDFEADVFLAALDTEREFEIEYGMGVSDYGSYKGTPIVEHSNGGIVKLKIPGKATGPQSLAGVIKMVSPETGEIEYHAFNQKYLVAKPTATVAPTKMMVMYRDIKNPITVSVPGIPSEDLIISVEGGTYTKDNGAGNYFVEPNNNAKTVVVKVSGKTDEGKVIVLGAQEFRLKSVPDPVISIGGITGGKHEKEELAIAGRLSAKLKDFDFQGYEYTVESYTVLTIRNNIIKAENVGASFSREVKEMISNTRSGQTVIFQDIIVKTPKGERRSIDNSITVTIK